MPLTSFNAKLELHTLDFLLTACCPPLPRRIVIFRVCHSLLVFFNSLSVASYTGSPSPTPRQFSNLHFQGSCCHYQQPFTEVLRVSMLFHPISSELGNAIFLSLVMFSWSWVFVHVVPAPGHALSPLPCLACLWFAIRSQVTGDQVQLPRMLFVSPTRSFAALCCPSLSVAG